MFKDKTFKCRVCDSCGRIVEIPGLEDFPAEELYEVKNLKTGSVDEICNDCLHGMTSICDKCGNFFYDTDMFQCNGLNYCPHCAEEKVEILKKDYFDFIKKFKSWKAK